MFDTWRKCEIQDETGDVVTDSHMVNGGLSEQVYQTVEDSAVLVVVSCQAKAIG